MSSKRNLLGIALGLLLVLLLVFLNRSERAPERVRSGGTDRDPGLEQSENATDAGSPTISRQETSLATPAGQVLRLGRVEDPDGTIVANGTVSFAGPREEGAPAFVVLDQGTFEIPQGWSITSPRPTMFQLEANPGCPSRIETVTPVPDGLVLKVGPRRPLRVFVRDLAGAPIAGASVQVFAPLPYRGKTALTDAAGLADLEIYSTDPRIGLRATAAGYERQSEAFDASTTEEAILELSRLFGAAIEIRDWPNLLSMAGIMPGDAVSYVRNPTEASFKAAMKATYPESETGYLTINVLVSEKRRWLASPPIYQLDLAPRGGSGLFDRVLEMELLPLQGQLPVPFRLDESLYPDLAPVHPFSIRLLPREAFLADPPEHIRVRFMEEQNPKEIWNLQGKRRGFSDYQFSLPAGRYFASSMADEFADEGSSLFKFEAYEVGSPQFARPSLVVVAAVEHAPVEMFLAADERYTLVDLRDEWNRESSIGARLAPADGPRIFAPNSETFPYGRFIRPGIYNLWFVDYSVTAPPWHKMLLENLIWPSPTTSDGRWVLQIPVDRFPAAAFASTMR